jgi:hypothetical protein
MQIYIKEWPNRAATLYTEAGEELWTFFSLDSAMALWAEASTVLGRTLDSGDIGRLHALIDGRVAA